ncbi:MAG TPA: hypothetical protein VH210_08675 [Gaiellaceae bacterium]|nr:hypothetical protein [Gaiellaceae bacterium]
MAAFGMPYEVGQVVPAGIPTTSGGAMGRLAAFAAVPMANAAVTPATTARGFRKDTIRRPPS